MDLIKFPNIVSDKNLLNTAVPVSMGNMGILYCGKGLPYIFML